MRTMIASVILALGWSATALAQEGDQLPAPPIEDALPTPTLDIDRIPPRTSYEFAVQFSYGAVGYFRDEVPPWIGFGLRGGYGKNLGVQGAHRVGANLTGVAEGPIGVHTTLGLEPHAAWDFVGEKGLSLGAGVGPAVLWHSRASTISVGTTMSVVPSAALRIGWSQTYSRVGRRLFLFVEPKARMIEGRVSPVVAVAVGSGRGR